MSEINEASTHEVPKQRAREMREEFAKERLLTVWNEHDTTDLAGLVTEDVVWIDPNSQQTGTRHQRSPLIHGELLARNAWPALRRHWAALGELPQLSETDERFKARLYSNY